MQLSSSLTDRSTQSRRQDQRSTFLHEVIDGLSRRSKSLPSKYFYDHRGSQLFEQICELDEYYPTRTELAIMGEFAEEMGEQIGPQAMLIEFGSGSSTKTRHLLDHLIDPVAYVPVDVSCEHLHATAEGLAEAYPDIEILPVCADFTKEFRLPQPDRHETHDAVYFPGSTIGNFLRDDASRLLRHIVTLCGSGGGLIIGIDLQKDVDVLEAAYNDVDGVTAEFNLNLLRHINRELDADFDLETFRHHAEYNAPHGRIEMYLESLCRQSVSIGDQSVDFAVGERICTEYSHKYTIEGFAAMAEAVGLTLRRSWTDDNNWFAVLHLVCCD